MTEPTNHLPLLDSTNKMAISKFQLKFREELQLSDQ